MTNMARAIRYDERLKHIVILARAIRYIALAGGRRWDQRTIDCFGEAIESLADFSQECPEDEFENLLNEARQINEHADDQLFWEKDRDMTTEQLLEEQHELDCQRAAEIKQLVEEAAALSGRPVSSMSIEWLDVHRRRHVAPATTPPPGQQPHDHSDECWCKPTLYQGAIVHWPDPPTKIIEMTQQEYDLLVQQHDLHHAPSETTPTL